MKKTILLIGLLLCAVNASALQVQNHLINVELDEGGFAKVVEKYVLKFEDILEVNSFNERRERNSSSVTAWKEDFEFFAPRFESAENKFEQSSVSYEPSTNTLILEYELKKPLPTILKDEPRETLFSFSGKQLNYFIQEGIIVIPENTTITIFLPVNAQILGQELPAQIEIAENKIILRGMSTSRIDLRYTIAKPISTTVNSLELIQQFFSNSSNIVIIIVALIILAVIIWKKNEISQKIENYVVEHSELEHREHQEEIELEV